MHFRLRTLMILLAVGPPTLAFIWLAYDAGFAGELGGMAAGTVTHALRVVLLIYATAYTVWLGRYALAWAIYLVRYSWWCVRYLIWRFQNRE
jgi:hypothetical protein